jgi:threonyl-tRNA synthetase
VDLKYVNDCIKLAEDLGIRADVDDREEKLSRKIRDAEIEWINMIIVYGEKEKGSQKLSVRMRNQEMLELSVNEIKRIIEEHMKGFPYRKLSMPTLLSKNIVFHG